MSSSRPPRGRVAPKKPSKKFVKAELPEKLVFGVHMPCSWCRGTGKRPKKKEPCGACKGTGVYSSNNPPD